MGTHCESDRRLGKLLIIFKSLEFFNAITLVERKIVFSYQSQQAPAFRKLPLAHEWGWNSITPTHSSYHLAIPITLTIFGRSNGGSWPIAYSFRPNSD